MTHKEMHQSFVFVKGVTTYLFIFRHANKNKTLLLLLKHAPCFSQSHHFHSVGWDGITPKPAVIVKLYKMIQTNQQCSSASVEMCHKQHLCEENVLLK